MLSKKQLAVYLSKLETIKNPKVSLEQYQTDSEIAAHILWIANLNNDIKKKSIADFGAGTGIFAKGSLKLGAKKAYLIEKDKDLLNIAKENIKDKNAIFLNQDIQKFNKKVDTVFQNPPFGTKTIHADKKFLKKAFETANTVYSIHKIESNSFIEKFSKDNNFTVKALLPFDFLLKKTLQHHKKTRYLVKCGCWILKRD